MSRFFKTFTRSKSNFVPGSPENSSGVPKLVVAHFMVGNTAPYTPADWEEDIKLASSHRIDGFALNVGKEDWQLTQIVMCFDAAEKRNTDFRLFLSFDMSSFPSSTLQDIQHLKTYITRFATHPFYLNYHGKALVSTFAGENALFGYPDAETAWKIVKESLEDICPIFFIPSFFIDPRRIRRMSFMDGAFNWNGCWPIHLTPDSPPEEVRYPKLQTDAEYLHNLRIDNRSRKAYMASVSPWFFTHYGEDSWNKNWIYRGDDWLLVRRWQQLIDMRDDVDIVQIISWNDYGESHYIGPVKGAQPNSETWVNGFDHIGWLHLCGYFARIFKSGTSLSPDLEDCEEKLYVWSRPHFHDIKVHGDAVGRPKGWELTDDVFWIVVLARAPAHVNIRSSWKDHHIQAESQEVSKIRHKISAGISMLSYPFTERRGIHIQLVRNGNVVLDLRPHHFVIESCPRSYNFNARVAMCSSGHI